jgi:ribosome-binding factor A
MPPRDTRRPDRVAEAVREEIATVLAEGVKDPRITGLVTVTGVDMSRDLGQATVYVSVYGDAVSREETMAGLASLASSLRGRVGRALKLRLAPAITFKQDDTIARAAHIESLLASIRPRPGDSGESNTPGHER